MFMISFFMKIELSHLDMNIMAVRSRDRVERGQFMGRNRIVLQSRNFTLNESKPTGTSRVAIGTV